MPPDGKLLPLPEGTANRPNWAAGDELKTLPNPFLIGSQPPPARPAGSKPALATALVKGRMMFWAKVKIVAAVVLAAVAVGIGIRWR